MEEIVEIDSEELTLEGLIHMSGDKGVVITHPHPLYGGDMHNNVVEWMAHVYQSHNYTTLRFNFRGAGKSKGTYDNGIGEQQDVLAAISTLKDKGISHIELAGYSFGSWINAKVVGSTEQVDRLIMISPPVDFVNFNSVKELKPLALVVTGSMDDIAPAHIIQEKMILWNKNAAFEVIGGADHFYSGYRNELMNAVSLIL